MFCVTAIPAISIMVEVATTTDTNVVDLLQSVMGDMLDAGTLTDAVVAQNEGQRREMWERREAAAEMYISRAMTMLCMTRLLNASKTLLNN